MAKLGPKEKPLFNPNNLKKIPQPNRPEEPAKAVVPAPHIDPPPPYSPMKAFKKWFADVHRFQTSDVHKGQYGFYAIKNENAKSAYLEVKGFKVAKKDWPPTPEWVVTKGGFNLGSIKTKDDGADVVMDFKLKPGQELGFVLNKGFVHWPKVEGFTFYN